MRILLDWLQEWQQWRNDMVTSQQLQIPRPRTRPNEKTLKIAHKHLENATITRTRMKLPVHFTFTV